MSPLLACSMKTLDGWAENLLEQLEEAYPEGCPPDLLPPLAPGNTLQQSLAEPNCSPFRQHTQVSSIFGWATIDPPTFDPRHLTQIIYLLYIVTLTLTLIHNPNPNFNPNPNLNFNPNPNPKLLTAAENGCGQMSYPRPRQLSGGQLSY